MRKFLKILALGISLSSLQMVEAFDIDTDLKIETGYRRDDARWKFDVHDHDCDPCVTTTNCGDNNCSPTCDTASEDGRLRDHLRFSDQDVWLLGGTATFSLDQCGYIRLHADYGWITDGKFKNDARLTRNLEPSGVSDECDDPCNARQSLDLVQNNHLSRSIKDGHTWSVSLALGYPFFFNCDQIRLMPLIGYDYNEQEYKVKSCFNNNNNCTTTCSPTCPTTCDTDTTTCETTTTTCTTTTNTCDSHKRHNTYTFEWYGPWLGVNLAFVIDPCWRVMGEFQYHFLQAKGKLKDHDETFCGNHSRRKSGHGYKASLGFDYRFWCNWHAGLNYAYRYNESNGSKGRINWRSNEITANIGYLF